MEAVRILIAMSNEAYSVKLRTVLVEAGYTVIDYARDGHECLRKVRALRPDLVVLEYNLSLMNGYEVSRIVIEDRLCDIILVVAAEQESLISDLRGEHSFVYMTKPINKPGLINTIDLMVKNRRKVRELEKQIEELKASLDARKDVEKAKGLLMKHLGLSEAEAYKRIQKQSMDRGIPMKEIAKAIILAYDI